MRRRTGQHWGGGKSVSAFLPGLWKARGLREGTAEGLARQRIRLPALPREWPAASRLPGPAWPEEDQKALRRPSSQTSSPAPRRAPHPSPPAGPLPNPPAQGPPFRALRGGRDNFTRNPGPPLSPCIGRGPEPGASASNSRSTHTGRKCTCLPPTAAPL